MKFCVPVKENKGLASIAFNHFGSAPFFIIYDSESAEIKVLDNKDLHHVHGKCQPLNALGGEQVDAVLVGGIGGGAYSKLNSSGIKVYKIATTETIEESIEKFKNGQLEEFTSSNSCNHHHGNHDHHDHHDHHHGNHRHNHQHG